MNWLISIVFLSLLYTYATAQEDVLELTDDTFDETIKKNPYVLVKFYAPWCGHCKAFAPEYEKAAKIVKEEGKPYILARVDATTQTKVAEKVGVNSYPTIKFYINGEPINYENSRTTEAVIAFLDKKSKPPTIELKTKEDIINVQKEKGRRCILGTSKEEVLKVYIEVGKSQDDYIFYNASPELLKEVFPEVKENNVVLLKDYDEGKAIYGEELSADKFKEFLSEHVLPLVSDMTEKVVDFVIRENGKIGIFLFRNPSSKDLDKELEKVANELKSSDYVFTKIDITSTWGSRIAEYFTIDESNLPLFEIVEVKKELKRYKHTGKLNSEEMKKFIEDWKAGKVPRFYKSEPEPEINSGPVYTVVGKTFKKEVIDNDDDVIVKFCSPKNKHYRWISKNFMKLAESLVENRKLKFVEIDVNKNEIEDFPIEYQPTVKMFKGNNKTDVALYEGDYSEYSLAVFIKNSASYPVDIPELRPKDEGEKHKDDL